MSFPVQPPESVLLVTLDSCRYDTALSVPTPAMERVGPLVRAMSPSHFTLASHAAFWVGTTPGVPGLEQPVLNPKAGRLFRLVNGLIRPGSGDIFLLEGRSIVEGFGRLGYRTLGTGAVDWFDTATPTARVLTEDFQLFRYVRGPGALPDQLSWLEEEMASRPTFCFVNVGETHVPYWHPGAPWSPRQNPCVPFGGRQNDAGLCRERQAACLVWSDGQLSPLLDAFANATILLTADHGDCWGEDGLWEHGTWHRCTMEVPLRVRVRGVPCSQS